MRARHPVQPPLRCLNALHPVRCGAAGRHEQAGQSLLIALGLLFAGALAMFMMFSAGQVAATKQRLTDTADAAAWSAALWRARVLNYHAYSNRAIVANEVAIAQAVTMVAWARYFESLTQNAAQFSTLLPVAEPVLTSVAQAAVLARESAELAARIEIPARGAEAVGYKEILQTSQEILQLASQGFALNMVTAEVARANDPDFFAWVLPDPSSEWLRFTRQADTVDERKRLADVVRTSLDPFVAGPRSEDLYTPIPSLCLRLMRLRKRGITTLSETLDRWEAVDAMSFHLRTLSLSGCKEREALPLGWGGAEAGTSHGGVLTRDGELGINPQATSLAAATMFSEAGYAGIARSRELNYESLANTRFPVGGVAVVARVAGDNVPTVANRGLAGPSLTPTDLFTGESQPHVWALSAAEVYFRRPSDAAPRTEYASLFNPYWQVRLVAPTAAQRLLAQGYQR
jgi:hypothetical protein